MKKLFGDLFVLDFGPFKFEEGASQCGGESQNA